MIFCPANDLQTLSVLLPWCQRESPSTFRPTSPQFFWFSIKVSAGIFRRLSTESEKFFFCVLLSAILFIFSHIKNYTPKQVNEQFQPKWTAALSVHSRELSSSPRICCPFFREFFYRRRGGCEAAVYAYIIMWAACVHSSHDFDFAWYRKHVIFFIFSPRRCVLSLFPTFFTIVMNRMKRLGQSLATTVRSRLARTKWLCLASRENVAISHPKKNLTIRSLCSSRQSRGQRRKLANHTHTHTSSPA